MISLMHHSGPRPTGPHGAEVDPQEDLPRLCRASRQTVKERRRCVLCGMKISGGSLMLVSDRWSTYKHAACVTKARARSTPCEIDAAIAAAPTRPEPTHGLMVVVTGGRGFANYPFLESVLDQVPIRTLAHGGALGADFLAGRWARRHQVPLAVYPAQWGEYGPRAGPIRNTTMLDEFGPQLVVAFTGGIGTAHCVREAKARSIPVWETTKAKTLLKALVPSG